MDWVTFLEDNHIEYVTRGPNTKRGEVSIRCPWCGEEDPSQHLGISLDSENWGCLRDRRHSGHSPIYLIAVLLSCSRAQAKLITGQYSRSDPETLGEALAMLEPTSEADSPAEEPEPTPIMRPIFLDDHLRKGKWQNVSYKKRFWNYLGNRGFDGIRRLVNDYNLTCCVEGRFKDRVIIPVYRDRELVAWTGRALTDPRNAPRYLSSKNLKSWVFNQWRLSQSDGRILFICEGPFDAMKVDYYGRRCGARATCTFGTNVTVPQIMILNSLIKNFERAKILFDSDATNQAMQLADWLPKSSTLTHYGAKDPGSMTKKQVEYLAMNY